MIYLQKDTTPPHIASDSTQSGTHYADKVRRCPIIDVSEAKPPIFHLKPFFLTCVKLNLK